MKSFRSGWLLVLVALCAGAVAGDGIDPTEFKSGAARNATETYSGALAKLGKDYKEKCDVARKACIAQLTTAQAAATKAGNLDEAIRIRDAIAKLGTEIQDSPAASGHPTFATERQKLAAALANTIWQNAEGKIRFNEDGSGVYMDGPKPDAAKPVFAWIALTGKEVIVRYSSGWTNRMEFDDSLKTYALHDTGNGKKLEVQGGKRVQ